MNPTAFEISPLQRQSIEDEIFELESRLEKAKAKRSILRCGPMDIAMRSESIKSGTESADHFLLLMADSALPLGSFAFSSGLESYLAHTRSSSSFSDFLTLSLASYASTTLPFVLAAHRNPLDIMTLDDSFDAAVICAVARRASVAQGRALLSIWDRSFRNSIPQGSSKAAVTALSSFTTVVRSTSSILANATDEMPSASAHLGPLFGAVACILGIGVQQTAYIFMLSHVKALLSAAVRASIFGPYQAQKLLASAEVQSGVSKAIENEWNTNTEDAGQCVPIMDLWIGRHEMLYSRIFNS